MEPDNRDKKIET